ncbi:MAG: coproporphyrinogen III oxidase, partial [Verrucomicrobiota bacterium]
KTLGRDHTPEEAVAAFEFLRSAGFSRLSLDLMFSVPGQSPEQWAADLEMAASLGPQHLSTYNLTYEEDTSFLDRHLDGELDANEDRDADFFYAAIDFLNSKGFEHYEISNFCQPGFESEHNQAYWQGEDYLGLGPGAVTTWKSERWTTLADTAGYVRAIEAGLEVKSEIEHIDEEGRRIERIGLALRTSDGIPRDLIDEANPLESFIEQGLLEPSRGRIRLTREGKALADPIAAALV